MTAAATPTMPFDVFLVLIAILCAAYVLGWYQGRKYARREILRAPPRCVACGATATRTDAADEPLCDQHYADMREVDEHTWSFARVVIAGIRPRRNV